MPCSSLHRHHTVVTVQSSWYHCSSSSHYHDVVIPSSFYCLYCAVVMPTLASECHSNEERFQRTVYAHIAEATEVSEWPLQKLNVTSEIWLSIHTFNACRITADSHHEMSFAVSFSPLWVFSVWVFVSGCETCPFVMPHRARASAGGRGGSRTFYTNTAAIIGTNICAVA